MLLHDARRDARITPNGDLVLLEDQDRARWDRAEIDEGQAILDRAIRAGQPGAYQVQAAIAGLHDSASQPSDTDWREIAALYGRLATLAPSPVVELNRAVAIAMADGPEAGLERLAALAGEERLAGYPYSTQLAQTSCAGLVAGRRPQVPTESRWSRPRTRSSARSSRGASPRWSGRPRSRTDRRLRIQRAHPA